MKTLFLLSALFFLRVGQSLAGDTQNPVQSYATFHGLTNRVVYQWTVDLNHDGKAEVLLDTKLTPAEAAADSNESKGQSDSNVHDFDVYIAKPDGSGYTESTGMDDGTELGLGVGLPVDISQCFVGQISQLNKWGLVTVQTDYPRKSAPIRYVYAYTIENDHIKRTLLVQYDPGDTNTIYNQYLSGARRTQIQLQEITVP